MNISLITGFLRDVVANNNREWFQSHRAEYDEARAEFERAVADAISMVADIAPECAAVTVKDATYRFYRDTRFSPDKSPYKNHMGGYINARGKKALHGGYYFHVQPDYCFLAVGNYCLPTNVLNACRMEMLGNREEWLRCVESKEFIRYFGEKESQRFGFNFLKRAPKGFEDAPEEMIPYLRMKDYCAWHNVAETFYDGDGWLAQAAKIFKAGRPMLDFINNVVDDYE